MLIHDHAWSKIGVASLVTGSKMGRWNKVIFFRNSGKLKVDPVIFGWVW